MDALILRFYVVWGWAKDTLNEGKEKIKAVNLKKRKEKKRRNFHVIRWPSFFYQVPLSCLQIEKHLTLPLPYSVLIRQHIFIIFSIYTWKYQLVPVRSMWMKLLLSIGFFYHTISNLVGSMDTSPVILKHKTWKVFVSYEKYIYSSTFFMCTV